MESKIEQLVNQAKRTTQSSTMGYGFATDGRVSVRIIPTDNKYGGRNLTYSKRWEIDGKQSSIAKVKSFYAQS